MEAMPAIIRRLLSGHAAVCIEIDRVVHRDTSLSSCRRV
jgi:hypothetical protein